MIIDLKLRTENSIEIYLQEIDIIREISKKDGICGETCDEEMKKGNSLLVAGNLLKKWGDIAELLIDQLKFLRESVTYQEFVKRIEISNQFIESNFSSLKTREYDDLNNHFLIVDDYFTSMTTFGINVLNDVFQETIDILKEVGYSKKEVSK